MNREGAETRETPALARRVGRRELGWLVPVALVAGLWIFGFAALDRYNVTWDEALGDFFFGERYLSFFASFDPAYLDFESDPYPPDRRPDLGRSPFRIRPWEYYPFANTLAAATSEVLSRRLGLLDPYDGFHAVNLLFAAVLVWVFFRFLAARYGLVAATAALGLLLSAPRVFAHLMANIKDFPLMVLFALTAVASVRAYEVGSAARLVGAGALWGLALATKANALFFPPVALAVVVLGELPVAWRGRWRRLWLTLAGAGLAGAATTVAVWPYLWADPLGRLWLHLEYIGFRGGYTRPESVAPALAMVLQTTPPVFLALFVAGLPSAIAGALRRDRTAILLLAWIAVTLGRFALPGAVNFDGVRHFLELFPPMAAVAGLGLAQIVTLAARAAGRARGEALTEGARRGLAAALLTLALLPGAWALLRTHPFQIAYWNAFAGGYAGARACGLPQASDYWGMSYRLGFEWLNRNAPEGALLAVPVIEHAVRLVAPERLRPDIVLLPVTTPFSPRIAPDRLERTRAAARTRPLYVMFVDRRDWRNELMLDSLRFMEPQAVWELEGEPVLAVYLYEPDRLPR